MRTGELRDITPLLTYGYQVRIGEYVSRGWDLLQPKLGIFVGYILVLFGINLAISLLTFSFAFRRRILSQVAGLLPLPELHRV